MLYKKIAESQVRCQWDPERDIHGNPLQYRSLQLGLRGKAVQDYVDDWILQIADITDYVMDLDERRKRGEDILALLPQERVYKCGRIF